MAADDTDSSCAALAFPVNAAHRNGDLCDIWMLHEKCKSILKKRPDAGTYCLPNVITNPCDRTKELSEKRSTWLMRA